MFIYIAIIARINFAIVFFQNSSNEDVQRIEQSDEQEDNIRNESTESNENAKVNGHKEQQPNNNGHNGSIKMNEDECDSDDDDDDNEVNYTYELDPNVLNYDSYNDENMPENPGDENDEEYDDKEDVFESFNRNQPLEQIYAQANLMRMQGQGQQCDDNGQQGGFYYCEFCPKYYFDPDQLKLHMKRSHGANKLNECNICGKTYAWKSGLYKHKRHVHGISGKNLNFSMP